MADTKTRKNIYRVVDARRVSAYCSVTDAVELVCENVETKNADALKSLPAMRSFSHLRDA